MILICGPRPKSVMTGVALAVELLIEGLKDSNTYFRVVDATFLNKAGKAGTFSVLRALETALVVIRVWLSLPFCNIYYATMSTSIFGFLRDYLTVGVASLLGKRTVLHLHGGGFEDFYKSQSSFIQWLIRSNLKKTDMIVVLGELLKEQFYCAGEFAKSKLVVVPNGLTYGVDEPVAQPKTLPRDEPIQLLYLSSLMSSKGYLDVIEAMKHLYEIEAGRFHLHLCGGFVDAKTESERSVTNADELAAFLKANELENAVTYHGQVTGIAKNKRFEQANVFLLPTSYPWEGQPLSIIEALAYNTPIVSCYHKGIPEQLEDGVNGKIVPAGNPNAIAEAVVNICESDETYSGYSSVARRHYERNFRREVHLENLLSAIKGH